MPIICLIDKFVAAELPLIDVRSPGEFAQGHIPGANNIPLFSDAERAVVGTLYKQQGRDAAMLEGLRLVGPKLAGIVEQAKAMAPDGKVRVHCWRGGERSASVAWLLEKAAGMQVFTLKQGYKAFRHHVLQSFILPRRLHILGGYTGTGKTQLLKHLEAHGQQVLDLEGLANHKGSSYGGIGTGQQPSTEHFENLIWDRLRHLDQERPTWVEDESQLVGRAKIPDAFFARMRTAHLFFVDRPQEERVDRLVHDYGAYPKQDLADATLRLRKRLGPQNTQAALEALDKGALHDVARITLGYYDKTYRHGLASRSPGQTTIIPVDGLDEEGITAQLMQHGNPRT